MNKILGIAIGITLFILIVGAAYTQTFIVSNNSSDNENYTQEQIVYNGKFPIPMENFLTVTSGFGYRDPIYNSEGVQVSGGKNHYGIDLVGKKNSKIFAVKEGVVTFAGKNGGYGNCVEIRHNNDGVVFYTLYAHMQDNSLQVQAGQIVNFGQIIGIQGTTGNSTGDHLHFEIRLEDKTQIDPAPYLFYKKEVG